MTLRLKIISIIFTLCLIMPLFSYGDGGFKPDFFDANIYLLSEPKIDQITTIRLDLTAVADDCGKTIIKFRFPFGISIQGQSVFDEQSIIKGNLYSYVVKIKILKEGNFSLQASIYYSLSNGYSGVEHFYKFLIIDTNNYQFVDSIDSLSRSELELQKRVLLAPPNFSSNNEILSIYGYVKYYHDNLLLQMPIKKILVKLFEISDKAFNLIDTQYTDNDGFYIFDKVINKPKVSFQLKISFVNDALKLIDGKNILYEFDMPMIENVTDSSINADCIFNEENQYRVLGHIFNCINDAHTFLLDNLSWSRKLINVKYPYKADNSKYTYIIFIGGKMINEIINIATNRAWNRTSMLHEYGHAVMTALYDYNYYVLPKDDFRGDPDANYSHSVYTISEEGFAMKEGWAEFFEALIDDNAFNRPQWKTSNTPNIEYNEWWKGIEKNNIKGELVEGAVASILWDIADTADSKDEKPNIDDDKINGRLNDLWNLIAKYKPSSILEIWNYWIDLDYGQIQSLYYIYKSNGVKTIMPYDLNSDGKIDVADMIIVGSYLGKSVTGSINLSPDINKDNKVDVLDILKVGKNMDQ